MMQLSAKTFERNQYTERVLQFGEGNFLRAFADWMIHKMNKEANFDSSVVVVQPIENGLIDKLNEQDGLYTLYLQGIKDGEAISEYEVIQSISRGINPYSDFNNYLETSKNPDMRFVISNTTEAGIYFEETDEFYAKPQKSYPGKLTRWLYERYEAFEGAKDKGMIIIPCELIDRNGDKLKDIITRMADQWGLDEGFKNWINEANVFCNTLVDRIVPGYPRDRMETITKELGYEDQLVVEGEQFHLWVIEAPAWVEEEFPARQLGFNVLFVDDMTPYRTRKVRILNGAHTSMVPVSYLYGLRTVRETVEDDVMGQFVREAVFNEIIPTLSLSKDELESFAADVIDRFRNPYIKHYLISIALNSNSKYCTRVLPSVLKYKELNGELPNKLTFALAALIRLYKGEYNGEAISLKDDPKLINLYQELWKKEQVDYEAIVSKVLQLEDLWGQNLSKVEGMTEKVSGYLELIDQRGMEAGLKEVLA